MVGALTRHWDWGKGNFEAECSANSSWFRWKFLLIGRKFRSRTCHITGCQTTRTQWGVASVACLGSTPILEQGRRLPLIFLKLLLIFSTFSSEQTSAICLCVQPQFSIGDVENTAFLSFELFLTNKQAWSTIKYKLTKGLVWNWKHRKALESHNLHTCTASYCVDSWQNTHRREEVKFAAHRKWVENWVEIYKCISG